MIKDGLGEGKDEFVLRSCLREKNAKMLGFLYNVEHQIAVSEFDKKFVPFSELKLIQQNEGIQREEVRRIFLAMSQKLHARIIRDDAECERALNKLQTLWEVRKIQFFHRYYFQKYLFSTYVQNMQILIKHEDQLIRMEQHIYFSIHRAIWAREASLNHLNRKLKQLGSEDMHEHFNTVKEREIQRNRLIEQRQYKVHGYRVLYRLDEQEVSLGKTKMECLSEDFRDYRKLTAHVVQLISKWKEYIQSLTHDAKKRKERMEFYYEEKNYILSLLNDSSFISHSFLNKFYLFSIRNDPFLLKPLLGLEGKQHQKGKLQFEDYELKKLIQISEVQFASIVQSVQFLFNELQANIRNRKVYNTNAFNKAKSLSLDQLSLIRKQQKLVKTQNKPGLPLSKSQILKINIGSRQSSNSLTKSNVLLRTTSNKIPKTTFYTNSNNNNFKYANPEAKNPYKMLSSDELKLIKQQVYKKVKFQLQYQTKRSLLKSTRFEQLIDQQVKASFDDILSSQTKQQLESALEVTPISFAEQEIGSFLSQISKSIPLSCLGMQRKIDELSKILSEAEYCYILRVHTAKEQVGNVIAVINYQVKQYKQIQILFVSFRFAQMLQKIMTKTVQFIWKYQNAKEMTFQFTHSSNETHIILQDLRRKLSSYSVVVDKKNNGQTTSIFRFSNKTISEKELFNPYPMKMHFKLQSAIMTEKVKLDSSVKNQAEILSYDYLIMQMLRQYTNSEDFIVLRDTFRPKQRFRQLLILLMKLEENKSNEIEMTELSAENVSELNYRLMKLKKPLFQIQDLTKINNIKALLFEFTVSPAYPLKIVFTLEPAQYHRYQINGALDSYVDEHQTQFFMLDVHESHHYKIILFDASRYFAKEHKTLSMYLYQKIGKKCVSKKNVANIWVQMVRYPSEPTQQQQHYINTFASFQFESTNKHLFVADYFDWFTDVHLQNGVSFQRLKEDVFMRRPFGVGLVTNTDCIIYCRVFE